MQSSQGFHLSTIGQLIVSLMGACLFFISALLIFLTALLSLFGQGDIHQTGALFGMAWTATGMALLNLPALVYAILRLLDKPASRLPLLKNSYRSAFLALTLLPLILVVGTLAASVDGFGVVLASPLQFFVIVLPLWVLYEISSHNLQAGSPQRRWGLFSFGVTITPIIVIVIEMVIMLVFGTGMIIWASNVLPGAQDVLNRVQLRISFSMFSPEVIERVARTYAKQPLILYSVLAMVSGFGPLIEELFKPLALWLLINRRMTPSQGFVAGTISGLAFAMVETMTMSAGGSDSWLLFAVGRMVAGLLHMTLTGIMGWALASTFADGKYLRLALTFIISVLLHGLWNACMVLWVVNDWVPAESWFSMFGKAAPFGSVILVVGMVLILIRFNRRLSSAEKIA